jgi:hypothetical protein
MAVDWQARYEATLTTAKAQQQKQVDTLWGDINLSIREQLSSQAWATGLHNKDVYHAFSERWHQLEQQLEIRERLINRLTPSHQARVLGFGPSGVRNFRLELDSLLLRSKNTTWLLFYGGLAFMDDSLISPIPIFLALIKITVCIFAFIYWRRIVVPLIQQQSHSESRIKVLLSWWYLRLRQPLEWLIFLLALISAFATLWEFIDFSPAEAVLKWALIGLIVLRALDAWRASRYRQGSKQDEQAGLRTRSLKLAGFIIIVWLALRSLLLSLEAGDGTIQAWMTVAWMWLVLPIAITIVNWWRPVMLNALASGNMGDNRFTQWAQLKQKGLIGLAAAFLIAFYLSGRAALVWIIGIVSQQEAVKTWLAYFFRVEVARQAAKDAGREDLSPLEGEAIDNLMVDYQPPAWLPSVAEDELKQVATVSCTERSTISLVHAGRGGGKSSFINRLQPYITEQRQVLSVQCLPGGFNELIEQLAKALSIEEGEGRAKAVISALKQNNPLLICIDDLQRIICPAINGLYELERLVRLIRSSAQSVSWVLAIETPSWSFVERARGERFMFDIELALPRWSDDQINDLIQQRIDSAGIEPSFESLEIPQGFASIDTSQEERLTNAYTKILWEYAKGNPRVSLGLWRRSLYINDVNELHVKLFASPDTSELDSLSVTLLLVLRAILQLEISGKTEVARCTNLSSNEVVDALRLLVSRGYIERVGEHCYGIKWFWYRAIILVLERQHLLKI